MTFAFAPFHPHARCAAVMACCALAAQGHAWAQSAVPAPSAEAARTTLERVEVVGSTPIPGTGLDRNQLPGNVQHLGGARLRDAQAQNLPDLLRSQVGSVSVVETQGNPFQLEVNFRGFSASPLLGQPQGLSVFLDGVRLNEAFGDVVNWDLVPRNALASLTVMPGSNPLFGLNTLGGALALQTKRGDTHPGTEVELGLGSFGRRSLELSHGRALGEQTQLFVAGDVYREDGWRQQSPSEVRHLFARIDHRDGPLDATLSLLGADNTLVGNGPLPESMLAQDRSQVYTLPDRTHNQLAGLTGRIGLDLGDGQRLDAQGHLRSLYTRTLNGDLAEDWDGVATDNAVEHLTHSRQRSQGLTLQWQRRSADALLIAGLSHDRQHSDFEQRSAPGMLDDQRAVIATGEPALDAALQGRTHTNSVYATTTLQAGAGVAVTASGRYNETRVTNVDVGRLQGLDTALDSDQRYRAFNPALGATWTLGSGLTAYGNASQGNRAPSPIELGCSDPDHPCILPNALQSDPPLKQVISRTLEAGLRGELAPGWRWNAGAFRTDNRDDILFVSNHRAAGYFTNAGRTRRQGVELGLSGRQGALDAALAYTWLDASYRTPACIVSPANSSAGSSPDCPGADEIAIQPGDRLPGLPRNLLKLDLGWRATPALRIGANWQAQSGVYLRGNENNQQQADASAFNGSGRVGGFALLNLQARWRIGSGWSLLGKVNNVFDRHYATGGQLGQNAFDASGQLQAPGNWRHEAFVAPGAPRSFALALQWQGAD